MNAENSCRLEHIIIREIKIRSPILYLNGNKHAQIINNSLRYFHPFNQTTPVAVDNVVNKTSPNIQDVELSAANNSTIITPSNPSSNTSNDSSE